MEDQSKAWPDEVVDRASKRYSECTMAERPVGHHVRDWMRSALEASGAVFLTDEESAALRWTISICREAQSSHDAALESAREKLR